MTTDANRLIATTSKKGLIAVGSGERPLYSSYEQLTDAVSRQMGPASVYFFTQPFTAENRPEIDWYTALDGPARRFDALTADEQAAALEKLAIMTAALSAAVERLKAEGSGDAAHFGALIERALSIPDENAVWLIGEHPVLVGWGFQYDKSVNAFSLRQFIERNRRDAATSAAETPQPPPPNPPQNPPPSAEPPAEPPPPAPPPAGGSSGRKRWAAGLAALGMAGGAAYYFMKNEPPTAVDDEATTAFETPVVVDVLANDADPEGKPLTLRLDGTDGLKGRIEITPGDKVLYTPPPGFHGKESFRYTAVDVRGAAAQATATITVNERPNRPPVFKPLPTVAAAYETPVVVDLAAALSDPDGDALTLRDLAAKSGKIDLLPGNKVKYTPDKKKTGPDEITFVADDGRGGLTHGKQPVAIGEDPCAHKEFSYKTPGGHSMPVPATACVYSITLYGAGGGGGWKEGGKPGHGGDGGVVAFRYAPKEAGSFDILVGQGGVPRSAAPTTGGGGGGGVDPSKANGSGGSGGGASAIAFRGVPLGVAGGGGGGGGAPSCVDARPGGGGGNGRPGSTGPDAKDGSKAHGGAGGRGASTTVDGRGGSGGSADCSGATHAGAGGSSTLDAQEDGAPAAQCSNGQKGEGGRAVKPFRISGGGGGGSYPSDDTGGGGGGGFGGGGGGGFKACGGTGGGGGGGMINVAAGAQALEPSASSAIGGRPNASGADGTVVVVRAPAP